MQSKNTPPPKSSAMPNDTLSTPLHPSASPNSTTSPIATLPLYSSRPSIELPPSLPTPLQQLLDHLHLSTNMKFESLFQRFDQLLSLFSTSQSPHNLPTSLTLLQNQPITTTLSHTVPMTSQFRPRLGFFPRQPPPPPPFHTQHTDPELAPARGPKLRFDPPKFDGSDPAGWLFRVDEYFEFYATSPDEPLRLIGLLLDGQASEWFRWMRANTIFQSWEDFVSHVRHRFDPDHFEDYVGAFSKLRQTTTVLAYQSEFERLLIKVSGMSEATLLSVFISGLKPHLRRDINLRRPANLTAAFALARELSLRHTESAPPFSPSNRRSWQPSLSHSPTVAPTPTTQPMAVPQVTSRPYPSTSRIDRSDLPIRRLTFAEKQAKDASGLCYNYDEKWPRSYRCQSRLLLLIGDDEDDDAENTTDDLLATVD